MVSIDANGDIHDGRGQYAGHVRSGPAGSLSDADRSDIQLLLDRRRQLQDRGYLPAVATWSTATSARSAEGIEDWHEQARRNASVGSGYPLMPDDYVPGRQDKAHGRSAGGNLRVPRRLYEGGGLAVRMYDVSTIRQFASDSDGTFEMPIELEGQAGNSIIGHVRVTKNGPGQWSVEPLGFPPNVSWRASEAVTSILESRRPAHALRDAGDLLERHRQRLAKAGAAMETDRLNSSWVRGVGYNRASEEMVIQLGDRTYGYRVDESIYRAVRESSSVGGQYNALVKHNAARVPVQQCPDCRRWFNEDRGHQCRRHTTPSPVVAPYDALVQAHVAVETREASFDELVTARELYNARA